MSNIAVSIGEETNRAVVGSNVRAEFFMQPELNPAKSQAAQRPVYDMIEMVSIRTQLEGGGWDRDNVVVHFADSVQRARFPTEYAKFRAEHGGDNVDGHPLKMWPPISIAKVKELAHLNIYTVEALANTGGEFGDDIEALAEQARNWLDLVKLMDPGTPRRPGRPRKVREAA